MRKNKLRRLLKEDKPTIGARIMTVWPGIVEILGLIGVIDYVEFLGEYVSYSLSDLENLARASELFDISSMMKVDQNNQDFVAKRALGAGIQNILFTDVRNVEQAKNCISIVKAETPEMGGTNGCHMRRNVGYVIDCASKEYVKAMGEAVIVLMIEKKPAVDQLEEIFEVKGIDMVQFGPGDYSMSVGLEGQSSHIKVKEAEKKVISTALKYGIRPRAEIDSIEDFEDTIKKYIDLGVKDFSLPDNATLQYEWYKKSSEKLKGILDKSF